MLGDFKLKNAKRGRKICIKIDKVKNEIFCNVHNHSYMYDICTKEFSDSNFNQAVIDKISINQIASNFTYS